MSSSARAHFARGAAHFDAKDYEPAISEFEAAFKLDPRPEILFAWAQAERLSGDCPSAIVLYDKFLATHPSHRQGAAARDNRVLCEQALATRPPSSAPERGPAASPPEANPPENPADLSAPPAPLPEAPASPSAPESPRPAAQAIASPVLESSRPPVHTPWYKDTLGDLLTGAGVAALGVGATFWLLARSDAQSAQQALTHGDHRSLDEQAQSKSTIAWVTLVAGSSLVAAGVVRYLLRKDPAARADQGAGTQMAAWASPTGGGLLLEGAF